MTFIRLFTLLSEEIMRSRKSWLSPSGVFYYVKPGDHHATMAEELSKSKDEDAYYKLMQANWMRIVVVRNAKSILWVTNSSQLIPNNSQRKALIHIAEDNDIDQVIFENTDTMKDVIIWERR